MSKRTLVSGFHGKLSMRSGVETISRSSPKRPSREKQLRVERLEDRCLLSASTSLPSSLNASAAAPVGAASAFTAKALTSDFNGDGTSALLWRRSNDIGEARIWELNGGSVLSDTGLPFVPAGWKIIGAGDFNGDGKSDLVWRRSNDVGGVRVWLLNGGAVVRDVGLPWVGSDWKVVGVGDFNRDGKADLVWRRSNDVGGVRVWLLNGGTIMRDVGLPWVGSDWKVVGVGDSNGDGCSDLFWRRSDSTGTARVWLLNDAKITSDLGLAAASADLKVVGVGDFNGDGKSDLLWRSNASGEVRVWELNGGTVVADIALPTVASSLAIVGISDFNGDGKADLVLRRSDDIGETRIWELNGGSVLANIAIPSVPATWKVIGMGAGETPDQANFLGINDAALASLTQSLFADGSVSRLDMIQILRSAGSDDGVVDATELANLKIIVSNASYLKMPEYVQVLASDVVNGNIANAHCLGSTLGNLAAGSSNAQLTKLVNKWFLGTDHPITTSGSYTYKTVSGSLFVNGPAYTDVLQGNLGTCYFIAALGGLAKSSTVAITNMFADNGDGTWTVRFYYQSGASYVADYVTVDKMLPVCGTSLIYSGYGLDYRSGSNELWIALAEKAYAQWNETGREGRNGTNTYEAIEGGWMDVVNAQVLGRASSYYGFYDGYKQTLINAIAANKAITIGVEVSADGLVGNHAYTVIGYNAGTNTFQLYNPWGCYQPGPLTWAQLKADSWAFVVSDTSGLTAKNAIVSSTVGATLGSSLALLDGVPGALNTKGGEAAKNNSQSVPLNTVAADVCYNSWGTDAGWLPPSRAWNRAGRFYTTS